MKLTQIRQHLAKYSYIYATTALALLCIFGHAQLLPPVLIAGVCLFCFDHLMTVFMVFNPSSTLSSTMFVHAMFLFLANLFCVYEIALRAGWSL